MKLLFKRLIITLNKHTKLHDGIDIDEVLYDHGIPELKFTSSPERIEEEESTERRELKQKKIMKSINMTLKGVIGTIIFSNIYLS